METTSTTTSDLREVRRELTRDAARRLDQAAQTRFGIPGIVLMESAARAMSDIARALIGTTSVRGSGTADERSMARVVIVCGMGNNGGDGYAMARHLANAGAGVELVAVGAPRAGSEAAVNEEICRRMGIAFRDVDALATRPDLVVDALFGTGLDRAVVGPARAAIDAINRSGAAVLSLDLPSGIDNDTGVPLGDAVRANLTAVTVAPRPAMRAPDARRWFGKVRIVDIGAPPVLLEEFGQVM